jgi:mono/diheme cytochrome c family protein
MRWLAPLALVVPLLAGCSLLPFGFSGGQTISTSETVISEPRFDVPRWVHDERLPDRAVPGAKLFALVGCSACHTYDGAGGINLGAPDLTAIGKRHLGVAVEIAHLRCPSCVHPGSPMPPFGEIGPKRLRQLAVFLEASKGIR